MYKQYISKDNWQEFSQKYKLLSHKCSLQLTEKILNIFWGSDFCSHLSSYCLMIIKPECIAYNKTQELIEILRQYKFELIYYKHCLLTPAQVFETWEYSWQTVTCEHIYINQKLYAAENSIILLLKNTLPINNSACEFLTDLKGSAYEDQRRDYQIRTILKPLNISLNFIHTSDTIFDLIYEMGILFSSDEIQSIIQGIEQSNKINYGDLLQLDSTTIYANSISPEECLSEEIKKIRCKYPNKIDIIDELSRILNHRSFFKLDFILRLEQEDILHWNWTWILIISSYVQYKASLL